MVITENLTTEDRASILALARRAESADGVFPLNEDATLALEHGTGRHLLAWEDDLLVGYAYQDSAWQLLVDPEHRRHKVATRLLAQMGPDPELWAFGNLPCAQGFCAAHHFRPVRGLLVMETQDCARPAPLPPPQISGFVASDLADLQRLNARIFAHHPEQGGLTTDDFLARMNSEWFDPEGLLIVRDEHGAMIGFHWTKVADGIGEVYVIGVDPDHTGTGLGRRLLDAGLHHMGLQGVRTVRLWVEDNNNIARSLYKESGFSPIRHDIRYRMLRNY